MSRYVDADRFKDILERASEKMHLICGIKGVDIGAVIKAVDMLPTADVVEVVRCRDCIFFEVSKTTNRAYCDWHREHFETCPNDYCSRGERREE